MNFPIVIISAPVNFGKTTILQQWIENKQNVGGILCPDIDGLRKLMRIRDKKLFDFQIKEGQGLDASKLILVGKFQFLKEAFEIAIQSLKEDLDAKYKYIIVDELGKLEMKGQGLEPYLSDLIGQAMQQTESTLIIVIRDYLLDEAIQKYGLEKADIIKLDESRSIDLS